MIFKDIKNIKTEVSDLGSAAPFIAGTGLLAACMEVYREMHEFIVRRYRVLIPADRFETAAEGEKIKIAFLSDLHGKVYGEKNLDLIKAVRFENPDYILVGGDMLTRSNPDTDAVASELMAALAETAPTYVANGNHEQKLKTYDKSYGFRYKAYKKEARRSGVHFLENRSADLEFGGIPVTVTGYELPLEYYGYVKDKKLTVSDIAGKVGESSPDRYQILLAHNPAYSDTYRAWGADLTFSGHYHGGIVGIPGYGGLITPQAALFPSNSGGIYIKENKAQVVSRGLGTHTVNFRFLNPAELVICTLEIKKNGA